MGEDPGYLSGCGFEELLEIVRAVKREASLPVMLSPGLLPPERLAAAKEAGADWYALYQETHNRGLFAKWRRGQDYDARIKAKEAAAALGLMVEEGLLLGAGASPADLAESISAMRRLPASQARAMTYVPSPGGLAPDPLAASPNQELLAIALLRLSLPDALIPASLDVEGLKGLAPRVEAVANVVTSLVQAGTGLAGVASVDLDIDNLGRGAAKATEALRSIGHFAASRDDYLGWLGAEKSRLGALQAAAGLEAGREAAQGAALGAGPESGLAAGDGAAPESASRNRA